ncbi:hypothetical protein B0H10DRAFT_2230818 [Mycena sp. CBHHK59/15]|nr:hypothetical protein B0H10DRAFT_2230818 [Mycena sp. CBHHK59/15]
MPCDAAPSLLPVALVVMGSAAPMPPPAAPRPVAAHLPVPHCPPTCSPTCLLACCPPTHSSLPASSLAVCLPAWLATTTMPCSATAPLLSIHPLPICLLHARSLSACRLLTPSSLPACLLTHCPLACLLAAHHPLLAACPPTCLPASHHDAL